MSRLSMMHTGAYLRATVLTRTSPKFLRCLKRYSLDLEMSLPAC